jgi:sugar/nucleoside kinase (ribokinase family)
MRVAVLGPLCRDENIVRGQSRFGIGGVTYYAGQALSSLGADVELFATFGDEPAGWLGEFHPGVLHHIPAPGTITFINEYKDNVDEREQRAIVPRNTIGVDDIGRLDCDAVILGPLFNDNFQPDVVCNIRQPVALAAQGLMRYLEGGTTVVWRHPEWIFEFLPRVTYLFVNEEEARFITGEESSRDQHAVLKDHGASTVVITRGSKGSVIYNGSDEHLIPAFPPSRLADPTGCGDTYLAAFIFATGFPWDLDRIGRFAAMAATMKLECPGPLRAASSQVLQRLADFSPSTIG